MESGAHLTAAFISVYLDIVPHAVSGVETVDGLGSEDVCAVCGLGVCGLARFVRGDMRGGVGLHQALQHLLRIRK